MVTLIAVLLVAGLAFRGMSPEARVQLLETALTWLQRLKDEATRRRPECDQFRETLRERTRWVFVVPALVALNVTLFVFMLAGDGALGDTDTLVRWGGSFWVRTRNGEWWRLVTSMFVHDGFFQLLVNAIALWEIGVILERLVGRLIVASGFLAAGIFASLVNLVTHPMAASFGASGGVYGLAGILLSSSVWAMRHRSNVTMPPAMVKRLVAVAAVFVIYNLANDGLGTAAELTGLLVGLSCGAVLTRGATEHKPAAKRVGHVAAAAVVMAVVSAIPLRGVTDVKPELERTIATEDRTAAAYRKASERFRNGRASAQALADLIEETIVPELQVSDARLLALSAVPKEHRHLVTDAEEYVRLRTESWRLRAEWLRAAGKLPRRGAEAAQHRANSRTIARAEETERAALEVLQRIRPPAEPVK